MTEPSSFVVVQGGARLLLQLDHDMEGVESWQYRLTPQKRQVRLPNGDFLRNEVQSTLVNFFGWKSAVAKKANLYHYPLDPLSFSMKGIRELRPDQDELLPALLLWGQDVRQWCEENHLRVSPTNGGLAAQLLRDARFFPEARRKVPRATNATARPSLPGNYYRLYGKEGRNYQAYYLDMKAAHHTIAASLAFPHPDTLMARGRFRVTDATGVTGLDGEPWVRVGSDAFRTLTTQAHGLLYCQITVPKIPDGRFPLPYMRHPGTKMAWIYTNELPTFFALGGILDWISGAWVSFDRDPGLNRYARFALAQLDGAESTRKAWLKPSLLATYGILAARPRVQEFAFRMALGGAPREYPAGPGMLKAQAKLSDREVETPVVNVIYRGMIEAEQRVRALALARDLHAHGSEVIAIYADSVFVTTAAPLPLLPPGWEVEAVLDSLCFMSSTHFTSRQLNKLPGMPREGLARARRLEQIRTLARTS